VVFTECNAMERRCGAKLGNWGSPISAGSLVLLYVKHHVGSSAHDEALSGTLLVNGALGAVLVFQPCRALFCIVHYAEVAMLWRGADHAAPCSASRITLK
jgi:hypothetical protein